MGGKVTGALMCFVTLLNFTHFSIFKTNWEVVKRVKTYKNCGGDDLVVLGNVLQVQRTWPLNGTGPGDLRQSVVQVRGAAQDGQKK